MEKEIFMWVLGGLQAILVAFCVFVLRSCFDNSRRLTIIETMLKLMNKQAAEILHSPHTPELDILLEKLVITYEDRHFELSVPEWEKMLTICQGIKEDLTEAKGTRLLAGMVYLQCVHKLQGLK